MTGQADSFEASEALRTRRHEAARRVAALTFDLGGLVYEMARQGGYNHDLLDRQAAQLRVADGELAELERIHAASEAGVAGRCRRCEATHARGAIYCWRCGESLAYAVPPDVERFATPNGSDT